MKVLWWRSINIIFQNCHFCLFCCKFWVLLRFMIIKLFFFFKFCCHSVYCLLEFESLIFFKSFLFPAWTLNFFIERDDLLVAGYHSVKSNENPIPFCVLNLIWSMFDPLILQTHKTRQLLLYYSYIYIIKWIWHLSKNLINILFFRSNVSLDPLNFWETLVGMYTGIYCIDFNQVVYRF